MEGGCKSVCLYVFINAPDTKKSERKKKKKEEEAKKKEGVEDMKENVGMLVRKSAILSHTSE
jgi:hypothetical protein